MKNKEYKSITNLLEDQNKGKKFFSFMDMEDAEIRKLEKIVPLPKKYFNKIVKFIKGDKWQEINLAILLFLITQGDKIKEG